MIESKVKIYKKSEKTPEDYQSVIVFFGGHKAPDYYDPFDRDFHYYGRFMGPDDYWMEFPEEIEKLTNKD